MTFLHPALLWLLPLAAVPLLLHLLTLHRLRTVELSTYRFLFDSYIQQRRQMRFLEALLAMLRTLFLLALVLAVCRPVVRHWNALFKGGGGRDVLLVIDGSASMAAVTQGRTAFDRARAAALTVVERLGPDDRVTLAKVTTRAEIVFSRFSRDAAAIRDKIDGLKVSPARANFFAALTELFGADAAPAGAPLVYLFSDGQASGWREVRNQGLDRLLPAGTEVVVVNVGSRDPLPNLAVIGDAPRRQRALVGLPLTLQPRVVNHGTEPAEVAVSVVLNEKEIARTTLTLKPGEAASRKILFTPTEPGLHRGRFEIAAKNRDRFPDDDLFRFTLNVAPRLKVLLVNGNPNPDPFENETLYLQTALKATGDAGPPPGEKPAPAAPLAAGALDVVEVPEGGVNPATLQDAAVVILANCGQLNAQHFAWLRDYVAGGGGLLIFPGNRVNPDVYNQYLFPVPGPQQERLIGLQLGKAEGDPEKRETYDRLARLDLAHPALAVFDVPKAGFFGKVWVGRRYPLQPPTASAGQRPAAVTSAWPLAEFANGTPALAEGKFGEGTVILAAFPAHTRWTNLPARLEFVPLVLALVAHAARRPDVDVPPVVLPDGLAEIAVAGGWSQVTATVTDPAGRPTTLTLARSGPRLVAAYERTAESGYYTAELKGGRAEQPRTGQAAFAVNLAPEESAFTALTEAQYRELLPTAQVTVVDATAEAQQQFGSLGNEQEAWRPLIWIMFAIIGGEFLLATLGGGRGVEVLGEDGAAAGRVAAVRAGGWMSGLFGARQPRE